MKARLLATPDQRIGKDGVIVIKAQSARSLEQNKADALARLQALVDAASQVPRARKATKPTWGSQQRRLQGKAGRAEVKAGRRKVPLQGPWRRAGERRPRGRNRGARAVTQRHLPPLPRGPGVAMPEILKTDQAAVDEFLKATFGVNDDALRAEFAKAAVFFSDEQQVKSQLEIVSGKLRRKYHEIADGDQRSNVLTRAIMALAPTGFAKQSNVVFAGFISPTDITKEYISKKVLWKDGVGSMHGEFSHSLQWLCIAEAGILVDVSEVYAKSVDYTAKTTFERPGKPSTPYLWDFLVDCFSHGAANPNWKTHIVTATPRSPSYFNKTLLTKWSHLWISTLLADRYLRRGMQLPTKPDNIEDLKAWTVDHHKANPGYVATPSGTGTIYTRGTTYASTRSHANRGLPRHAGTVTEQEPDYGSGSVRFLPKTIKGADNTVYTVAKAERKLFASKDKWLDAAVHFELLGNPPRLPSDIQRQKS